VAYWLVPVALWSLRRLLPALQNRWEQWQGAFIVLYLPLVLANSAILALLTMFGAFGYLAFLLGILLLWWGFLQLDAERPVIREGELAVLSS
jgi:protein-S-isoprenylcysteine O-methyltransferase Ste14